MPLPTQQWRFVGNAGFSPASAESVLDAIYTLGTSSTYADGSSRTPGAGSAATWSRYQNGGTTEAVYATPATTTALAQRFIFAGVDTGSPTPTMASPDVFATSYVMASVNKNSGAFNAWDAASPFTSGQFHGYYNCWNTTTHGIGAVRMFECQEAVYLVIGRDNGQTQHVAVGAWLDPGSTNNADAESDGRLYGVYTSGGNSPVGPMTGTATAANAWMTHTASNNAEHTTVFLPGGSSLLELFRDSELNATSAETGRLTSGQRTYFTEKILLTLNTSPNNAVGSLRDMAFFGYGITGQRLTSSSSGGVVGHIIAERVESENESIILFRNA